MLSHHHCCAPRGEIVGVCGATLKRHDGNVVDRVEVLVCIGDLAKCRLYCRRAPVARSSQLPS